MDIVNAITSKNDWDEKIKNKSILGKWEKELVDQGANKKVVNVCIKLLQSQAENKRKYDNYEDKYDWILDLDAHVDEMGLGCYSECECIICNEGGEYCNFNEDDIIELEEDLREKYGEEYNLSKECGSNEKYDANDEYSTEKFHILKLKDMIKRKCICIGALNKDKLKLNYLKKFVIADKNLINPYDRHNLLSQLNNFIKDKPVQYQPNTNNTVVNIIHPSLNCYVNGITQINCNGDLNTNACALFQWLPAEYNIKEKKFVSPVNSLPMENMDMHNALSTIFEQFIPQFQKTLNALHNNNRLNERINLNSYGTLQVITKIASTELTPLNPTSTPTSWHLEGVREENIIATGIYYYEMKNVTDSHIEFRTVFNSPHNDTHYPQNGYAYVEHHYALGEVDNVYNGRDTQLYMGKISTEETCALVFPNFLQHRVPEFGLQDKDEPGKRSILVFFLVDPRTRIPSTQDVISNDMTEEEVYAFRDLLMFNRKYEVNDQQQFYERGWSLCEH